MNILICGSRDWKNSEIIYQEILRFSNVKRIIHGACKGADAIGGFVAERMGFEVVEFPARWDLYGRHAGPMRNQQMLDEGCPDVVLAFHDDFEKSKGTRDMARRARKAGIPVFIISENLK